MTRLPYRCRQCGCGFHVGPPAEGGALVAGPFCSDRCALANDRAKLERAGLPENVDYEALILAEDEEYDA